MVNIVMEIWFLAIFACIATYLFMTWKVERYLEKAHPDVWVQMGLPNLLRKNNLFDKGFFRKWILKKKYKELNDKSLTVIANLCRVFYVLSGVLFFAFGILAIAAIIFLY